MLMNKKIISIISAVFLFFSNTVPIFGAQSEEIYVMRMNSKDAIEQSGPVTADTTHKKSSAYTAKWTNHITETGSVKFTVSGINDWSNYDYVSFWAYSEVRTDKLLSVFAETSEKPKWRYCWGNFIVDWEGWKKISIDLSDLNMSRFGTLQFVTKIGFQANSWGAEPDERTVLYIDDIFLEKAECKNPVPKTDSEFNVIRKNWQTYLGINNDEFTGESKIDAKLDAISYTGGELWEQMNIDSNAKNLWGTTFSTATSTMTYLYSNINKMAQAYAIKGSAYYKNKVLLADIKFALEWMYENLYGTDEINFSGWRDITEPNWWDWQIGSPTELVNTLILMSDDLTEEEISKYLSPVNFFVPHVFTTDANKASVTYVVMASAVLSKDSLRFRNALRAMETFLVYADETPGKTEGFYTDGSYVFHIKHAMNGTYGVELLKSLAPIVAVLGTSISADTANMISEWFFNGFEPLIYNGGIMSIVKGRYPGVEQESGAIILGVLIDILPALNENDRSRIESYIKYTAKNDKNTDYYSVLTLPQVKILYNILNDKNTQERGNYKLAKMYGSMDKAVWQRGDFAVGLSMSSSRIFNYESISGCNNTGWYMGDGMLLLYNGNLARYNQYYWNNANKYRLPGTTADSQERQALSISNSEAYLSSKDFVGGVTLGDKFLTAAMDLESFHSEGKGTLTDPIAMSQPKHDNDLVAKKAWFMFDDEVVALGCDIMSTMNSEVVTTVENAPVSSGEILSVNSEKITSKQYKTISEVSYANLGNTVGYWFPKKTTLDVKYDNFAEILWSHGKNPINETYEYVMLPLFGAEQTKEYVQNPHITILSNNGDIQAVREEKLNATGIVFRKAAEFEEITAENPCIVMKRDEADKYTISVAEPTHKADKTVIKVKKDNLLLSYAHEKMSIKEENGYYLITINTTNSNGSSFEAVFTKKKADSPVRVISEENSSVKLCVSNNAEKAIEVNLIIAEYDSHNKLQVVASKPYTIGGKESEILFNSLWEKSGCKYRWFVWEKGTVKPIW